MGSCSASDGLHDALLRASLALAVVEILDPPETHMAINVQH